MKEIARSVEKSLKAAGHDVSMTASIRADPPPVSSPHGSERPLELRFLLSLFQTTPPPPIPDWVYAVAVIGTGTLCVITVIILVVVRFVFIGEMLVCFLGVFGG